MCTHVYRHTHTHTCSGFLNGAAFFNSHLDGNPTSPASIATGAMFLIVAILWILGLPVAIVLLIMVKAIKSVIGMHLPWHCHKLCVYTAWHYTHTQICIYFLCGAGRRRSLSVRSRLNDEMDPEERVVIVASNQ